jgi:hypothetical protein
VKQPTEEQRHQLAQLARNYPHVLTWINEWYSEELTRLPSVSVNVALAQGRCLVLSELIKQLTASLNAKP